MPGTGPQGSYLTDGRELAEGLLGRFSGETVSYQLLKPEVHWFFCNEPSGLVGYVDTGDYWLAAGSPVAAPPDLRPVADRFAREAADVGKKVAFFGVERSGLLRLPPGYDVMQVGVQPVWDPRDWSRTRPSEVGRQVRRAARKGVQVRQLAHGELACEPLKSQVAGLIECWLDSRPLAPMGFLVQVDLLADAAHRAYFGAFRENQLVGVLACIPARDGWFLEHLLCTRGCPNGTSDSLVDAAMVWMEERQVSFATMGLVPLAKLQPEMRERHPVLSALFDFSYSHLNELYSFQGLLKFKAKFRPRAWEPVFMAAPARIGIRALCSLLRAFAGEPLTVFGLRSVGRRLSRRLAPVPRAAWATVANTLAALLIPWIAILLACDSSYWFGNEWLARAWAGFDVVVGTAFAWLGYSVARAQAWGRTLARLLLGAVMADAWLTWSQTLLFSWDQARGPFEKAVVAVATAAPTLATLFLLLLLAGRSFETEQVFCSRKVSSSYR